MAKVNNNASYQFYRTPPELLTAIEARFGKLEVDLAATEYDTVAPAYFDDALKETWPTQALCYCNPPFRLSRHFARKFAESGARGLLLTPASIDSNWFSTFVLPHARVIALQPRVTFVGESTPINRPLILSAFRCPGEPVGFECWRWYGKKDRND